MVFASIDFLYYFLPTVIIFYFLAPTRFKNIVLLIASMFFYFYGEQKMLLIMLASAVLGYIHGLWIGYAKWVKHKKLALVSSVVTIVGILVFFKYTDFFINNINKLSGAQIPLLRLALPIGISFYTFQVLSYTIDVYLSKAKVQKNILNFVTYVILFPQLIAGPIVRYTTVEEELSTRKHSFDKFALGVRRFVIGLAKKVLLANTLAELGKIFTYSNDKSLLFYWIYAIAFTLQIYFDFSGYSDMAIGLGHMFGFTFLENFNYPFISESITEFWRRWHMSLGTWFRDYVYIPMGGNRVSKSRWVFNVLVVWMLTGFWHGAEWNFIFWGLYFAVFLVLEKKFLSKYLIIIPRIFRHLYLAFVITISFVIFNGDGLGESILNLKGMFGLLNVPLSNYETTYYLRDYGFVMLIAIIASTPLFSQLIGRIKRNSNGVGVRVINFLEPIYIISLLLIVTSYLIDGSFNPFIYFRF